MATVSGQQLEASRYKYNHPCGDLLESERRGDYINICIPLYRASIKGDLKAARVILKGREHLVRYSITEQKETPLHVAAAIRKPLFVKYLVDMMREDDLELQNKEGNNAFCVAAIAGNREIAMIMLQKNRQLLTIRGSRNMMPLYLVAFHGKLDMITYLYDNSQRMASDGWTDDDRNGVFLKCIESNYFDVALRILNDREELPQENYASNVMHVLAMSSALYLIKPPIVVKIIGAFMKLLGFKLRVIEIESEAKHLLRKIWKGIVVKNNKDEIDRILRVPVIKIAEKDAYPSGILFFAAENGNDNFLVELIREYPDLLLKTNDDGQTIFHIGLSHHHHGILNLLYEIGGTKDTIAQLKDKDGNTLLHSVSKNIERTPYAEYVKKGASFELLHRLIWFLRVRALIPPSYRRLKNAAGQIPIEVFEDSHKDLFIKAKEWRKETSNQCMVVATLITTISFSAAFTIPGGYNQDTGFPMFLRNTPFTVFVIFDGISFILSSVSILLFLGISLSNDGFSSTVIDVHGRFMMGFLALLFSIISLMAAFSASFFILYHNKLPIIMSSLATLPIIIFFLMEAESFIGDVLTFSEFFMPKKPMLYN